jgi:hypothetical protein
LKNAAWGEGCNRYIIVLAEEYKLIWNVKASKEPQKMGKKSAPFVRCNMSGVNDCVCVSISYELFRG